MSAKLMTFYTLIFFSGWHSYHIQLEVIMNALILISLYISDFFEIYSFSLTYAGYFMLLCVFMLFSRNITINKTMHLGY